MRACLRPGDALLLGADLVKPERELLLAYDDKAGIAYGIVSWFVLEGVNELADRAVVPEVIFRTTLAVTFVIFPCLVIVVVLRAVRARDRRPDPPWAPKLVALAAGAAAVVLAWFAFELADQLRVRAIITESAFRWTIYILVVIAFVLILAGVARTVRAVRRPEAVNATQKADAVLVRASESTAEPPPRGST
jgi:amino acid transporter